MVLTSQLICVELQERSLTRCTNDEASLMKMASKARLVVNCTGPFKIHGEPVVRACIQQKCHYIDITAEPQFMERMLYNEEASEKGVYVVPACGLDSIPADMGVDFTRRTFKGTLQLSRGLSRSGLRY
jgi:short subunit dehydrogenase-like uncharacterized protein